MDETMSRATIRLGAAPVLAVVLAMALACAAPGASAQLADPTRPPPEARLAAAGGAADLGPAPSGPQLQSVLNGNHGRQVAVIDGQALRVGDKIHGATLVQVGKDRVVLQHGRTRQVLKLYPDAGNANANANANIGATVRRQSAPNTAPEK
ncbi:MSHA biogenesis protein MshK [Duganella sp. 3397]|uniref:MSHA biogenesis protein MshK n=1 Tax=Duganella sp. 3397 TaxID=2817732 RepID=UPI002864D332|nr:MSHA biogenesis protein MshK [Duganella sp. 3397]MDR7049270.1 MSHA biogenesis protein MshK [Duganella sp. 3397]